MIKCEFFKIRNDGVMLVRTYSDDNKIIQQVETGVEYDEAIDVGEETQDGYKATYYTYVETDKEIEKAEEVIE